MLSNIFFPVEIPFENNSKTRKASDKKGVI